jgi:hypothetical protein
MLIVNSVSVLLLAFLTVSFFFLFFFFYFLILFTEGEIWICKPVGMNQGKGIFLLRTREEIDNLLSERDAKKETNKFSSRAPQMRIVQRLVETNGKINLELFVCFVLICLLGGWVRSPHVARAHRT